MNDFKPTETFYRKQPKKRRFEKKTYPRQRRKVVRIYGGSVAPLKEEKLPLPTTFDAPWMDSPFLKPPKTVRAEEKISVQKKLPSAKPFPWPFFLALATIAAFAGVQLWFWNHQETLWMVKIAWVAACSALPGLGLMAFLGSLAQFRRRKIFSCLSIILCIVLFAMSILVIQGVIEGAHALN